MPDWTQRGIRIQTGVRQVQIVLVPPFFLPVILVFFLCSWQVSMFLNRVVPLFPSVDRRLQMLDGPPDPA